jgi:hypothetical protein
MDIRFDPGEGFVSVDRVEASAGDSWTFWSHEWTPTRKGKSTIRLRLKAGANDARKLDSGYYDRSVEIAEI